MILCLLPLKTDRSKVEYKYQMESLEEIGEIINSTFGKLKKLNLEEFKNKVEKHKSDIFIQIICFLYQKKPFTENNINVLKSSKKAVPNDLILQTPKLKNKENSNNILLPSPLKTTYLSPASTFLSSLNIGESAGIEDESEPAISGFNGMIRYQNRIIPKQKIEDKEDSNNDINNVIKNSDSIYNSPSVFLKKNKEKEEKKENPPEEKKEEEKEKPKSKPPLKPSALKQTENPVSPKKEEPKEEKKIDPLDFFNQEHPKEKEPEEVNEELNELLNMIEGDDKKEKEEEKKK